MRSALTILAGAFCASLALAQPGTTTRTETTTTTYERITTVVGQPFMLGTESLGKVVDVVFNSAGCIEYVLVQDAEGFIVVPFRVVTVSTEQKAVIVQSSTVTVDQLRDLRFTEARLPNFADPTFTQRVTKVWGSAPARSGAGAGTGTAPGAGTTTPGSKSGTTTPERKDRTDPKNPDPPAKGTTPRKPGTEDPPAKTNPKNPPKKEKDKDGQ
jgi:hypothetical protein